MASSTTQVKGVLTVSRDALVDGTTVYIDTVDCPEMDVRDAHLALRVDTLQLTLVAPCGCSVSVDLGHMIKHLGHQVARDMHEGAAHGTQTH